MELKNPITGDNPPDTGATEISRRGVLLTLVLVSLGSASALSGCPDDGVHTLSPGAEWKKPLKVQDRDILLSALCHRLNLVLIYLKAKAYKEGIIGKYTVSYINSVGRMDSIEIKDNANGIGLSYSGYDVLRNIGGAPLTTIKIADVVSALEKGLRNID